MSVINFMLTLIFISLPETLFVTYFVSIKNKSLFNQADLFKVLAAGVIIPILPNYFRFYMDMPIWVGLIYYILVWTTATIIILDLRVIHFLRIFKLVFIAIIIMSMCELLTFAPNLINNNYYIIDINKHFYINFVFSLPTRAIEFSILYILYLRKKVKFHER